MSDTDVKVTWKGALFAVLIGLVFLTGVSEIVVRVVYPTWNEFYAGRFLTVEHVPGYGDVAIGRKNFDGHFSQNNGDFRAHIRINDSGLRNEEPVSDADGRVWIVGDSMAFGWGVEQDEMYSSVIAGQIETPTYNVASPGTNVCGYQALKARMPESVKPRAVVVGLILENDLQEYDCTAYAARNQARGDKGFDINSIKSALTEHVALYNFFAVALKRVDVVREALIWAGVIKRAQAYRNLLDGQDVAAVTRSTAAELKKLQSMFGDGVPFVVLIAPARFEIANDDPEFTKIRVAMRAALDAEGIPYVDPVAAFKDAGFAATHFIHDGHWSAEGHAIAAATAAEWLGNHVPQ
ncbi:MAG: hypothetical protein JJ900_12670 [Rhodospirillales bacterium]|nr:hypothetical protein [Rhodospirillales bacterium]MBO6787698.1 hypothetical protein [Rhodospirillales bacterium]